MERSTSKEPFSVIANQSSEIRETQQTGATLGKK
jgi:DNA polymerase III delta prime subunit